MGSGVGVQVTVKTKLPTRLNAPETDWRDFIDSQTHRPLRATTTGQCSHNTACAERYLFMRVLLTLSATENSHTET